MPRVVTDAYVARYPAGQRPEIISIAGYDHACCWVERWPELLVRAME